MPSVILESGLYPGVFRTPLPQSRDSGVMMRLEAEATPEVGGDDDDFHIEEDSD